MTCKQPCTRDAKNRPLICNERTGRCVLRDGAVGKAVLAAAASTQTTSKNTKSVKVTSRVQNTSTAANRYPRNGKRCKNGYRRDGDDCVKQASKTTTTTKRTVATPNATPNATRNNVATTSTPPNGYIGASESDIRQGLNQKRIKVILNDHMYQVVGQGGVTLTYNLLRQLGRQWWNSPPGTRLAFAYIPSRNVREKKRSLPASKVSVNVTSIVRPAYGGNPYPYGENPYNNDRTNTNTKNYEELFARSQDELYLYVHHMMFMAIKKQDHLLYRLLTESERLVPEVKMERGIRYGITLITVWPVGLVDDRTNAAITKIRKVIDQSDSALQSRLWRERWVLGSSGSESSDIMLEHTAAHKIQAAFRKTHGNPVTLSKKVRELSEQANRVKNNPREYLKRLHKLVQFVFGEQFQLITMDMVPRLMGHKVPVIFGTEWRDEGINKLQKNQLAVQAVRSLYVNTEGWTFDIWHPREREIEVFDGSYHEFRLTEHNGVFVAADDAKPVWVDTSALTSM